MKPSELIEAAIEAIDEHGWCQHTHVNFAGNVCLMGGLDARVHQDSRTYRTVLGWLAQQITGVRLPVTYSSIAAWNDEPGRKYEEVRDFLMKGAKYFRDVGW